MDEYISKQKAIKLLENLGGCDTKDEYSKGYDEAIAAAIYDVGMMKPADVQPVTHWISIKDRLPEENESVLICMFTGARCVATRFDNRFFVGVTASFVEGDVTHWMPLPAPPKDGDSE